MKLIGYVFNTGRIDFTRVDNPWAFRRIDAGMKKSQADRIRVAPSQASVELRSAPVNGDNQPEWLERMDRLLKTADFMYLQYKSGVLRFRLASHDAGNHRTFVTLGNQDEFNLYASQNWRNLRYMYAQRGTDAFRHRFDVHTLITHRKGNEQFENLIEIEALMDAREDGGQPRLIINATGSNTSVDLIEWRGEVKEGERGRYSVDDHRLVFQVRGVTRPFTLLQEDRVEFNSDSYSFGEEKIGALLDRVVRRRLTDIINPSANDPNDDDDDFDVVMD